MSNCSDSWIEVGTRTYPFRCFCVPFDFFKNQQKFTDVISKVDMKMTLRRNFLRFESTGGTGPIIV